MNVCVGGASVCLVPVLSWPVENMSIELVELCRDAKNKVVVNLHGKLMSYLKFMSMLLKIVEE